MSLPGILFGVLLATAYGVAFHAWKGGSVGRLLLYVVLSWLGFWAGHLVANTAGWTFDRMGQLHFGSATLGSLIFLVLGYWLSLVEVERK